MVIAASGIWFIHIDRLGFHTVQAMIVAPGDGGAHFLQHRRRKRDVALSRNAAGTGGTFTVPPLMAPSGGNEAEEHRLPTTGNLPATDLLLAAHYKSLMTDCPPQRRWFQQAT